MMFDTPSETKLNKAAIHEVVFMINTRTTQTQANQPTPLRSWLSLRACEKESSKEMHKLILGLTFG
jgi:hypothetical protein